MTTNISSRAASAITESLPLIRLKRNEIEAAMRQQMRSHGPQGSSEERRDAMTSAILDMMFDQADRLGAAGDIHGDEKHLLRHRSLAMGGPHYSAFGDALTPIMKDVLGRDATPLLLASWIDFYWATVRATIGSTVRLAA